MGEVARLLTFVDVADEDDDGPATRRMSLVVRHEAVLADGRRVVLLDDRGWSEELRVAWYGEPSEHERALAERPGVWASATVEELEQTARDAVGPDEPFAGSTHEDMETAHWDSLAGVLRREGVDVAAAELRGLVHDVELSHRVLARLGGQRGRAPGPD